MSMLRNVGRCASNHEDPSRGAVRDSVDMFLAATRLVDPKPGAESLVTNDPRHEAVVKEAVHRRVKRGCAHYADWWEGRGDPDTAFIIDISMGAGMCMRCFRAMGSARIMESIAASQDGICDLCEKPTAEFYQSVSHLQRAVVMSSVCAACREQLKEEGA